jgi:hypothetical protein
MNDVADAKVQSVTGHRTKKMTDHYTHFDTRQFTEIREVQAKLLGDKGEKRTDGKRQKVTKKPAEGGGRKAGA